MFKKGTGIVYVWLRSFIYVIAVIMIIFLICFVWTRQLIVQEITNQNKNMGAFIQKVIDRKLSDLQHLSNEIEYNTVNISLGKTNDPQDFTLPSTYRFTNLMKDFISANSFFKEVYIYYPAQDHVVGNLGSYSSYSYYLLLNNLNGRGYDKWVETISTNIQNNYYISNNSGTMQLVFSQHIPINKEFRPDSILVVKINVDAVKNILQFANDQNSHSLVAMMDGENNLYTYDGDSSLLKTIGDKIPLGMNQSVIVANDKFILVQPSTILGIKYILVTEKSSLFRADTIISRILIVCIALCIIGGLLLSIYMSMKNAKPLLSLIKRFKLGTHQTNYDEYGIIEQYMNEMAIQSSDILHHTEKQQIVLNQSFLPLLINGNYNNQQTIHALAGIYEISFDHPFFCVIIFRPQSGTVDTDLLTLNNLINDKMAGKASVILSVFDNVLTILINLEHPHNDSVISGICTLVSDILANGGTAALVGVGRIYDNMVDIILSYEEAITAIDSSVHPGSTTGYGRDQADKNERALLCDFQRYLQNRQYDQAIGLTPALFNTYLTGCQEQIAKCRRYVILNEMLEVLAQQESFQNNDNDKAMYSSRTASLLASVGSSAKLQKEVLELLCSLQKTYEAKQYDKESVSEKAKKIIDNKYRDPLLGLYSIADELGVSNTYVSKTFKSRYKIGVVEYINQVRIENAKKLIAAGVYGIKTIAMEVGFSSDISFIRVFKKLEQTTPGKYKKSR